PGRRLRGAGWPQAQRGSEQCAQSLSEPHQQPAIRGLQHGGIQLRRGAVPIVYTVWIQRRLLLPPCVLQLLGESGNQESAMTATQLADEAQDDLLPRGYSRRTLLRIASVFGAGALTLAATAGLPAWASGGVPDPAPNAKVRIGANECWTGPLAPGQTAAAAIISSSNRYAPKDQRGDFIKAVMQVEKVPFDHVAPWPGSSD